MPRRWDYRFWMVLFVLLTAAVGAPLLALSLFRSDTVADNSPFVAVSPTSPPTATAPPTNTNTPVPQPLVSTPVPVDTAVEASASPAPTATFRPLPTLARSPTTGQPSTAAATPDSTAAPARTPTPTVILAGSATASRTATITAANTDPRVPAGMGFIPAGYFIMGAAHGPAPAAPEHPVLLSPYYLDLLEASNADYQQCVENGACTLPQFLNSFTRSEYYGNPRFAEFPVVHVTWRQAHEFCEAAGKRLPTEAEWEFAASGPENYHWPWGNTFEPEHVAVAVADTQPVDSFPTGQSPFGMLNMAGNVAEWVADAYLPAFYRNSPASNPVAEDPTAQRVYRGGSFGNPNGAFYATSYRYRQSPFYHDVDIGFRCAMTGPINEAEESFPNALVDEFCVTYHAYKPDGECP